MTTKYDYTSYGCMARVKQDVRSKGLHCDNDIFPSQLLEAHIEKAVMNLSFSEFISPIASTGLIDRLMLENADLKKQKERLLDIYIAGTIDKDTFTLRADATETNITRNNTVIAKENLLC